MKKNYFATKLKLKKNITWNFKKSKNCLFFFNLTNKLFLFIFIIQNASCVTVKVGNEKSIKASDFTYNEPKNPYLKNESSTVDNSWISKKNKNIIGISTDCPQNHSPTLESLTQDAINNIENAKIIDQKNIVYNARPAIDLITEGQIEGVDLKQRHLLLIKNGCSYKLFYSGLRNNFDDEIHIFDNFLTGFIVP